MKIMLLARDKPVIKYKKKKIGSEKLQLKISYNRHGMNIFFFL